MEEMGVVTGVAKFVTMATVGTQFVDEEVGGVARACETTAGDAAC